MMDEAPANWIPPKFREFIYEHLTVSDIEVIRATSRLYDENGNLVYETDDEIRQRVRKVIGVRDTRTGKIKYNRI